MDRDSQSVDWPTCSKDECNGIRLDAGGKCLAHADHQHLEAELKRLADEGTIDARGVTISAELLDLILEAAPRDEQRPDQGSFIRARFDGATFGDGARFDGATFGDDASFARATFDDAAWFGNVTFGRGADFVEATFGDEVGIRDATFRNGASFEGATFGNNIGFAGTTFGDFANFRDATFGNEARFGNDQGERATFGDFATFDRATFGDGASFENASFGGAASFDGATFGDEADFARATLGDEAEFGGATFGDLVQFGPLLARGRLYLRHAMFGRDPELAISVDRLDCQGMRLPQGVVMNVRWAEVRLDGVDFGRPSVLSGVGPFAQLDESPLQARVARSWRTARPRVLSLRGSDVRNLMLSNVDLRACRFAGTHNLDQLRLEATIDLADRPSGLRAGWAVPPLWRWTRRRTLAEEHHWRRGQPKHTGWYPQACQGHAAEAEEEPAPRPAAIALLYRALRKGREDSKDEPGAADFYYGEMEMRRHDRTAPWPERVVLWLYWLVAGYGLRASRALGLLFGVLTVATILLAAVGFAPALPATPLSATVTGTPPQQHIQFTTTPPPEMTAERPLAARLGTAVLVAVEGAVFRTTEQALTYKGRLIQATLRLVGPVLLGLALLSIRGRVKR